MEVLGYIALFQVVALIAFVIKICMKFYIKYIGKRNLLKGDVYSIVNYIAFYHCLNPLSNPS